MKSAAIIFALALSLIITASAFAEPEQSCRIIRAEDASYLEQCGSQLRSFSLSIADFKRKIERDLHGRFWFQCSAVLDCSDEPSFGGQFISAANWNKSRKDEQAIWDAVGQGPLMAAVWSRRGGPPPAPPAVVCPVFSVLIGDMDGRAICYSGKSKGGGVVAVVSDDHVGFMLHFYRDDQGGAEVRDKMMMIIPRIKIERAVGDVGFLRWMR